MIFLLILCFDCLELTSQQHDLSWAPLKMYAYPTARLLTIQEPISLLVLNSVQVLASLVVITTPILFSIPPFNYLKRRILSSFSDLVPYRSLISEEKITREDVLESRKYQIAAWGQIVLVAVGLSGVAIWSAIFGMNLLAAIGHGKSVVEVLLSAGMVLVWVSSQSLCHGQAYMPALSSCCPTASSSLDTPLVACDHLHSLYHPRPLPNSHEILRKEGHWTLSRMVHWSLAWTPAVPGRSLDRDTIHNRRTPHGSTSRPGSYGMS